MNQQQIISTILSTAFASTLTAIIRKLAPRLDGPALVWGVVLLLSVIGNVLLSITTEPHTAALIAWAVGRGFVGGIMAIGAVQILQTAAAKGGTSRNITVVDATDPRATMSSIDRDTTPEAPTP